MCVSLLVFVWFYLFLLVFQEAIVKNVTAEQGFWLCFYRETPTGVQVLVTAGVPVWRAAVC